MTVEMKIINHRLIGTDGKPVKFVESPNHGGRLNPKYLVMHYTAGVSHNSTASWFLNRSAKASAHLVIGRGGELIQTVPFNTIAWHAGSSAWKDRETGNVVSGMNACSIGIELVNAGRLSRDPETKRWASAKPAWEFEDAEVFVGIHKHEAVPCGWQRYTAIQLGVAQEIGTLLTRAYALRDVMGHEDVAPRRKPDPGPAFPMEEFRRGVLRAAGIKNVV